MARSRALSLPERDSVVSVRLELRFAHYARGAAVTAMRELV